MDRDELLQALKCDRELADLLGIQDPINWKPANSDGPFAKVTPSHIPIISSSLPIVIDAFDMM
jgi:hypothetical protein